MWLESEMSSGSKGLALFREGMREKIREKIRTSG